MDQQPDQQHPPTSERRIFLAPGASAGDGHGYRYGPVRKVPIHEQVSQETLERIRDATDVNDEPENVGPAIVDGYAESARFYDSLRHQAEVEMAQQARKLLTAEKRLQDVQRRAKQNHVTSLALEFAAMRDMIARAKAGGRKDSPAVVRKLEAAETLLDGLKEVA